ncbi:Uncharacterised protein [Salmonella enterica]|nr:Uncharacterised protein [Salmonella enterica]
MIHTPLIAEIAARFLPWPALPFVKLACHFTGNILRVLPRLSDNMNGRIYLITNNGGGLSALASGGWYALAGKLNG